MLTIIEGCDRTGKTTLANMLPGEVYHYGPPTRHPIVEYTEDLQNYAPASGMSIVTDRYHLGELVYGPMYRGESILGEPGRAYIEMFLRAKGAVLVVVNADADVVYDRCVRKGEDYIDLGDIEEILSRFHHLYKTSRILPTFHLCGEFSRHDAAMIAEAAHLREAEAYPFRKFTSYAGGPLPATLILGDDDEPILPYPGSRGREVFEHIVQNRLEDKVGVANVDHDFVFDLWRALDYPMVYAVNQRVQRKAFRSGLAVTKEMDNEVQ